MNPELHARILGDTARQLLVDKYMAGAREHGGFIKDIPTEKLVKEAINEALDQLVYLLTLQEKLQDK